MKASSAGCGTCTVCEVFFSTLAIWRNYESPTPSTLHGGQYFWRIRFNYPSDRKTWMAMPRFWWTVFRIQ